MSRVTGYWVLMGLWLVLGAAPAHGSGDRCAEGPAGALVRQSSFAHGYLHGYEAGFRVGDVDFQTAHVRNPRELREADKPIGYEARFGARDSFTAGFRHGFLAAYQDSISGRDFRAFQLLAVSSAGDSAEGPAFDQGFRDGYKAGDSLGAADLDSDADFDPSHGQCPAKPDGEGHMPPSSQAYCAGYTSAYRLGYTDGFVLTPSSERGSVLAAR